MGDACPIASSRGPARHSPAPRLPHARLGRTPAPQLCAKVDANPLWKGTGYDLKVTSDNLSLSAVARGRAEAPGSGESERRNAREQAHTSTRDDVTPHPRRRALQHARRPRGTKTGQPDTQQDVHQCHAARPRPGGCLTPESKGLRRQPRTGWSPARNSCIARSLAPVLDFLNDLDLLTVLRFLIVGSDLVKRFTRPTTPDTAATPRADDTGTDAATAARPRAADGEAQPTRRRRRPPHARRGTRAAEHGHDAASATGRGGEEGRARDRGEAEKPPRGDQNAPHGHENGQAPT